MRRWWLLLALWPGVALTEYVVLPELVLSEQESQQLSRLARGQTSGSEPVAEIRAFDAYGGEPAHADVLFGPSVSGEHTFTVDFVRCTRDQRRRWHCKYSERARFVSGKEAKSAFRFGEGVSPAAAWAVFREANRACQFSGSDSFALVPVVEYAPEKDVYRLWWSGDCHYEFSLVDGEAKIGERFGYIE